MATEYLMRQVGGMRRLGVVGWVWQVGRVRLVRRVRVVRVDRLGLDCKNVEKVRKLADKIPEKYNKVENTILIILVPKGLNIISGRIV